MSYAEIMAIPDDESSLGETENVASISYPSTPISMNHKDHSISDMKHSLNQTSMAHTINVNYRHCYSLQNKNGAEIDIPELFKSLVHHTQLQSPSKLVQHSNPLSITINETIEASKPKIKILRMDGLAKPLRFTEFDIPDPPNLKYANDLDQLIQDWDHSNHITIKHMDIPLKYWSQVFRWACPETWKVLKNEWSKWRVLSLGSTESHLYA
jgi:hypothetical protein